MQTLKAALDKVAGLPWVNTIATDRDGSVLYADASVVPRVGADKFASDCLLLPALVLFDGARSACAWGQDPGAPPGIYSPANGPWTVRTDYVANSNDSYWLNNPRALLTGPAPLGYSPLYGPAGAEQRLRSRIAFIQLDEAIAARRHLQAADLRTLMFADRVYAAELVLPDVLQACAASSDTALVRACAVLSAWDRRANVDSRGAVLFREFWNTASTLANKWAVPFDAKDPVHTPAGVAPAAMPAMLAALGNAALKLQGFGIPPDGKLGDYQGETRNGVRTPLHGGQGDADGSFNSIRMSTGLTATGYNNVYWGASYIQTVTFDADGPLAQGMLVYGQSVDPTSPYYADQIGVYARKEWPQLPFTQDRIKADPNYRTITLSQ